MAAPIVPALLFPPLWVNLEDRLYIRSWNSASDVTITVLGRILRPSGEIERIGFTHTPYATRFLAVDRFSVGAGWLLNLQCYTGGKYLRRGQCWVEVGIMRGGTAARDVSAILTRGYIVATMGAAWPGTPIQDSVEGPGLLRSITGTDPAAGNEITEVVPTNARWKLLSMWFQLVTSATVATRRVFIRIEPDGETFEGMPAMETQAASLTYNYIVSPRSVNPPTGLSQPFISLPPNFMLGQDWAITTITQNMQAGDNFSAPYLLVEEWIEE